MTTLHYLIGDATAPAISGPKIIAHVCNDIGGWGRGFVGALSARWKEPEREYRRWFEEGHEFALGAIQLVQVEEDLWVANMIGQHSIETRSPGPCVRYPAIATALEAVAEEAKHLSASVHMPRIGCGLAGGEWSLIEPIIEAQLVAQGVETYIYDLEETQ